MCRARGFEQSRLTAFEPIQVSEEYLDLLFIWLRDAGQPTPERLVVGKVCEKLAQRLRNVVKFLALLAFLGGSGQIVQPSVGAGEALKETVNVISRRRIRGE